MKRLIFVACLLCAPSIALAQGTPQSTFAPFTVTASDVAQLDAMLMDNPPRVYQQVIQKWIADMEHQAQAALAAAESRKKAEADLPGPGMPPKPPMTPAPTGVPPHAPTAPPPTHPPLKR